MKQILFLILIFQSFNFQISIGQIISTCSGYNKEFEKMGLNSLSDPKLKKMLEPFYILSDTDYTQQYFPDFYKVKTFNDSLVIFSIEVELGTRYDIRAESRKFDSNKHRITKSLDGRICLIDNKVFWGTYGDMPIDELVKLEVKINNKIIQIPPDDYKDLYNPLFHNEGDMVNLSVSKETTGKYLLILLQGSDGGGSYLAIWIFQNGKYLRRIVEWLG
jgi:hypothetical protein